MRTDFFVAACFEPEGERFLILRPGEIPASVIFAATWSEKLRELTLLTEDEFRLQLTEMGLSTSEVDYQLGRARGEHLLVR